MEIAVQTGMNSMMARVLVYRGLRPLPGPAGGTITSRLLYLIYGEYSMYYFALGYFPVETMVRLLKTRARAVEKPRGPERLKVIRQLGDM